MESIGGLFAKPSPAEQTARILMDTLMGAANVNRAALGNVELMIWQNPYGMTPQDVFNLLGTKSAAVLQLKAMILPLLEAAFPGEVVNGKKPENLDVKANEDGTVTVVAKA